MLACLSTRFTVVAVITALAVSTASIPRARGTGNGITIPLSKHSPLLNSKESVNIDGLKSRAEPASYMAKLLRGLDNYERDTGTSRAHPSALKSRSQNWKHGGAGLDLTPGPDRDVWYSTISIGTPPKLFTVQVDTGSSDLFIPASNGDMYCRSHDNLWTPTSSATAQDSDKPFEIKFADGGHVKGQLYTDNITIAGGFTADKQTIGVATTYSAILEKSPDFPSDGSWGLAFQSISMYPASSLLETLVSEGKLSDGVFSLNLTPDGGELYIGGVNEELYIGDITFVDVQTKGYWQVKVDDIRVSGKPVLRNVVSLIDTGSNYIYGDPDRVLKLHQAHGGKAFEGGWYTFPCDDFPDVTFTFGGKPFTMFADDLDYGPVKDGSPDCFSGILSHLTMGGSGPRPPTWTIETNFLQVFYTVFNMDSNPPQVGFAHIEELSELSEE